ncbi:MAG: glycosyltransferase family 2 protein [Bacteroidota bacterium]
MKISICIPQYNRIDFLRKNLDLIAEQKYENVEVIVSDDCSVDDTEKTILALQKTYRYPLVYKKNEKNLGYDRNLRQSLELASGDYCLVLGNDDSLHDPGSLQFLVTFLEANNLPDIGFCNYVEDADRTKVYERALTTAVLGTGYELAMKQYNNFSFVAGLIYKRKVFLQYNTDKFDGSIYAQIYLGCLMIAAGASVFSIKEILVIKDIEAGVAHRNSYRDTIAKKWKDYKVVDGGLPSVINVLIAAFKDAGVLSQSIIYRIFRRIYATTFPHWLLDYRNNGAFPEAIGLAAGLYPPKNKQYQLLSGINKIKIYLRYCFSCCIGLLTPVFIFTKMKRTVYKYLRR